MLFAFVSFVAVLTLWGTFYPVPFTGIRPQDGWGRRLGETAKSALFVRGTVALVQVAAYELDTDPNKVPPFSFWVRNTKLAGPGSHEAFENDLAAMLSTTVHEPSRTVPVPSRVTPVESDTADIQHHGTGHVFRVAVALISSLTFGMGLVLVRSLSLVKCLSTTTGFRTMPMVVRANSGSTMRLDSIIDILGLSSSSVASLSGLPKRYPGWDPVPHLSVVTLGGSVVPPVDLPTFNQDVAEEVSSMEKWEASILEKGSGYHPFFVDALLRELLGQYQEELDVVRAPRFEPELEDIPEFDESFTEEDLVESSPFVSTPVEHSSPLSVPVPVEEAIEALLEILTVNVPNPEPVVELTDPESGNSSLLEELPVEEDGLEEQQENRRPAESLEDAGDASTGKKKRNRPSRKTRIRKGKAKLFALQEQVIRDAEEKMSAAGAPSSSS
ncbi:hypothetical protein LOZ61_000553 [Ophidiomyces ophidiicola]|uniref:Uncharacterized protein n=1 Tax=Ophidiomyces ophidiicola TaxID=1387563 RepID=A0ACB8UNC8_9EURO|nr:hypothetical protein LOZ61_000553 [Ophidiomyces ophidiicola]KAI1919990.1 hypothetical protein LOZ60_006721 [Ophidiomyces ophidiicola]KAI2123963.1 hypothetical protein LOZ31_004428 [Ophidiomyces ophidiicola]KAI2135565.1 hypothetical protein LOZ27_006455 [Ophidiomyces ophidiicola]KAI2151526.1 hypothetical protein LOZ25_006214 [Ophidiomyces ophidiicola]